MTGLKLLKQKNRN